MTKGRFSQPYFGLKRGWLTFWVTVACATDMMLFGYDQGVFGMPLLCPLPNVTSDSLTAIRSRFRWRHRDKRLP